MSRKLNNNTGIPDLEIDSLARALLPAIQKFYKIKEAKIDYKTYASEPQSTEIALMPTDSNLNASSGGDMYYY